MANYKPPVAGGKIIGTPYGGGDANSTHSRAFNKKHGSDNWESENAYDIAVPVNTPVYAVADGTIGKQFGSLGTSGRFQGKRLHLVAGGNEFYYAHMVGYAAGIKPGVHVTKGQIIGYSGVANGVAHLHFAAKVGSPEAAIKGLADTAEPAATTPTTDTTTPVAPGNVPTETDPTGATLGSQLASSIGTIQQVGGAPLASAPLVGDQASTYLTPQSDAASSWQLIASNGPVSQDTIRLAQLASYGQDGSSSQ